MPHCVYCGGSRTITLDARYNRVPVRATTGPLEMAETIANDRRQFQCPACAGLGIDGPTMRFETIGAVMRISVDAPDEYRRDALIGGLKDRIAEAIARSITIDHRHIRQQREHDRTDEFRVEFRVGIAGVPFEPPMSVRHPVRHVAPPAPPPRPPMEVAEQLVGLVLSALDRIYFKGWAVLKEDAQQIIRDAMERVRAGNAPVMTREQVQERLGEHVAERRAEPAALERAEDVVQRRVRELERAHEARQMEEGRRHAEAMQRATMDAWFPAAAGRMNGDGAMEHVPAEDMRRGTAIHSVGGGGGGAAGAGGGNGDRPTTRTATEMRQSRDYDRRNAEATRRAQMLDAVRIAPPEARDRVMRRIMEYGPQWTPEELAEFQRLGNLRRGV